MQEHDFWEEVFILQGSMTDLRLGRTFSVGDYAGRPPHMPHGPWTTGPEGRLTFEVRYPPHDQGRHRDSVAVSVAGTDAGPVAVRAGSIP